jgi:hypothetical protein
VVTLAASPTCEQGIVVMTELLAIAVQFHNQRVPGTFGWR